MNYSKIKLLIVLLTYSTLSISQNSELTIEPYTFESESGEKVEAERGRFLVPENRSNPNSRNIELGFVRFKSTNPNPGNPIVYLAGGPGSGGVGTAQGRRFELFMALREVADVIAFDQRGLGFSGQIPGCEKRINLPLNEPGTYDSYISEMSKAAKECISFWKNEGVEIEGYTTAESANDLEALRKALGAPKINLWGISYGSHLAFEFIKRYEKSIDKVVLTGLEGPGHTIKLPEYNDNYLKILNAKIQEDPVASKVYPDLMKLMEDVLTKLEREPVYAEVKDRRSGKMFTVGISKLDVQLVTSFFLTKNPEDSAKLPYLYHQMNQGDFSQVGEMIAGLRLFAGRILRPMPLVMDAASGISEERWKKVEQQAKTALLGRTTNFPYPDISWDLDLPDLGKDFRKNPISSVPTLFFSGTLDGRTYMESTDELKRGFSNNVHVILDGAGHDLFMSTPRVTELIVDFFQNKKVSSQTIKLEIPPFVVAK